MAEVFCDIENCKHNYNNMCIKDTIQIVKKEIYIYQCVQTEKVCKDCEVK